jgi:transforming growth factor-beta-induced protein
MLKRWLLLALLVTLTALPAFAQDDEENAGTLLEIAAENDFTTLLAAVDAAGLNDALNSEGPFTVFAPTDAAFEALLEALELSAEDLLARDELETILLYHVVEGEILAEDVVTLDGESVETLAGETVQISVEGETVMVNNATVTATDVQASNGVIHVIDTVLLPPEEPAEEEAESTPEPMMEMTPEATPEAPAEEMTETEEPTGNIVEVAQANEFTILLEAALAAGLADTLSNDGPFTVFAPTDAAFEALLEELGISAADLLARDDLETILLYHVVEGEVLAEDVVTLDGESVETLAGATVQITVEDETVMVNDATVTATDVQASNGVIHVIDTVLLPPVEEETAEAEDTPQGLSVLFILVGIGGVMAVGMAMIGRDAFTATPQDEA